MMVKSFKEPPTLNVAHSNDFEYCIQVNRRVLKPIGVWPMSATSTMTEKVLARGLNIVCHTLITFTFAPCLLFIMCEETTTELKMKAIGPMSHWMMGELNYCLLMTKAEDILQCLDHMKHDWKIVKRSSDRELMLKNAKIGRVIACVAAFCMNVGVTTHSMITGFQKMEVHVGNETFLTYRLPCPFYTKLLDIRRSPVNDVVFAMELTSGFMVNLVTAGACALAAALAMHACGQLNVMMAWLDELVDANGLDEKVVKKKFADIVEHHLRTLSFVQNIEKIMNLICLVELVECTLNICMLEYYFITEESKNAIAALGIIYVSMIFNIFIFCYIGELLTEQCRKVGEKTYMMDWYRLPHKIGLDLLMIILRSHVTTKITAGKLVHISIATFGDVLKTSLAYFNMIRTVAM